MYTYLPTDKEHIHVYGRTMDVCPLPLFWTASGIEFTTDAKEIWVTLESDYETSEEWIEIWVNDTLFQRFPVMKGVNEVCVLRGYTDYEKHTFIIRKSCQPMKEDTKRKLLIHKITADRELDKVITKPYKFEFIGDSLTSGEGLTGATDMQVWCPSVFGLVGHYGLSVAKHFGADYSLISQSGWGVYTGWDNNLNNKIPPYYTQICGVLDGESNESLGAFDEYDFSFKPDVVVINLGTNDGAAPDQPEWIDPETGISHKQIKDENGKLDKASKDNLVDAVTDFMYKVRANNPNSYIIWAYGMCDHTMEEYLREGVEIYKTNSGDDRAAFVLLPEGNPEWVGSRSHPGVKDHAAAAEVLINFISKII